MVLAYQITMWFFTFVTCVFTVYMALRLDTPHG